jgi:carbamoyltransferase
MKLYFTTLLILPSHGWIIASKRRLQISLTSTPFEADLYTNPYETSIDPSSLAVSPDTRLVLGINKYTHDATLCAADKRTGRILFAVSKERLTRTKHDSGNAAVLVDACLEALDLHIENIDTVVMNNHHHRILPMESNVRHLEWESGLAINGGREDGYEDPENLLPNVPTKFELSHHLAHAYSTACQAPFEKGLVVVMDGMGETFKTMLRAHRDKDPTYVSDLAFGIDSFQMIPSDLHERAAMSLFDWRESESVYTFEKRGTSMRLEPVFKRFTEERTPPTLYNHGFENMDSAGALYSRVSSHIFGDWNACGKVMGLAPWAKHQWKNGEKHLQPKLHSTSILSGKLYEEGSLHINRTLVEGQPCFARNDPDLFVNEGEPKKRYDFDDDNSVGDKKNDRRIPAQVALDAIALADRMQKDLENICLDFVKHFKESTNQSNLCLAGGVALNSVLNGRLARELGFDQTFISPYPGDDGIAVGCCAFGLFGNEHLDEMLVKRTVQRPPVWDKPITPYLGPNPSEVDIKNAIDKAQPWLEVEAIRNENERLQLIAQEIASGGVVAWYHSRVRTVGCLDISDDMAFGAYPHSTSYLILQSELGPRALGHRSILADPRKKGLVRFINEKVKSRESFRPFAPSVLAEEAVDWFDLGECKAGPNVSPYMSITAIVRSDKRDLIPAVTHVDGSSRLQTVTKEAEPLYYRLISSFFKLTGVPMILNTSFNTLSSEPIVESPEDAVRSFMCSMGSIEMLVLGDYVIKRKQPDLGRLLGEMSKDGVLKTEPACPKRAGYAEFESSFELNKEQTDEDEDGIETKTRVRMDDRPMHGKGNEWFDLMDEMEGELLSICDGTVTMNDIMAHYTAVPENTTIGDAEMEDAQALLQNVVHRLVRLYERTLISW